jgi:hypothetical protein
MDNLKNILTEITQLTAYIETNYPELYRTLDENPMTLPAINRPHIDKEVMEEYLDSLRQLIKQQVESNNIKNSSLV